MDAMVLAAGLGTRLRPLTNTVPKALVPVAGMPMLDRVARKAVEAGADRLIVNTHHFASRIREHVGNGSRYGVEAIVVEEPDQPLETGGGVRNAAPHLRRNGPFLLHNADILSDLPLSTLIRAHSEGGALATLAVMERPSSRALLFDEVGLLGRLDERNGVHIEVRPAEGKIQRLAFAGMHVLEPRFLDLLEETGAFSILEPYLRLAGAGELIRPLRIDDFAWFDIGKPEQLARAEAFLMAAGAVSGSPG